MESSDWPAGGEEPGSIHGELVTSHGEGGDVEEAAVRLEGLVLGGESLLGGVGPGVHHQPLHLILEVS